MTKEQITDGVKKQFAWWIKQRKKKLEGELSSSMGVNPFLLPFLFGFHNLANFGQLADLLVAGHLMVGHATGFGKLIDEKVLPQVFGTHKLDKKFRATAPYALSPFDDIDHKVFRADGTWEYLSLKASKWTIQLGQAVQLNRSFDHIVQEHLREGCRGIVVGVLYGNAAGLTDKYDILRGINRGANHDVVDLTEYVTVYAGEAFWDWLSGVQGTQQAVMNGILAAVQESRVGEQVPRLLQQFQQVVAREYGSRPETSPTQADWYRIMEQVNSASSVVVTDSPQEGQQITLL